MSQLDSLVLLQETAVIDWSRPFELCLEFVRVFFLNFINESRFSYCHLRADSDCPIHDSYFMIHIQDGLNPAHVPL